MRNFVRACVAFVASLVLLVAAYAGIVISVKPKPPAPVPAGWKTYTDAKLGYSISYPAGWDLNRSYAYNGFEKEIPGVFIGIPESMTTGTNLSPSSTGVS